MSADGFKTPRRSNRIRALIEENGGTGKRTPVKNGSSSPSRQITVPSSPCLERLGYGTGVNVYLMERSPLRGSYRSPWAVKKVAKRFAANQAHNDFSQRLLKEAEILRALDHPNIVGYRTLTKAQDGAWCLAMEKAENCLMDLIEERLEEDSGPFPAHQVYRVAMDVAQGLAYLHEQKLLMHGDLKSGNVLVFGEDFRLVKLCDFGVALPLTEPNGPVKAGHFYVGTEAWSAPEVIDQDEGTLTDGPPPVITCKADIFSYGLTIWEMLSLCLPHAEHLDDDDDDDEEEEDEGEDQVVGDEEEDDDLYRAALGTRPALPDLPTSSGDYSAVVAVFIGTTEADPERRPKASEIVRILSNDVNVP